jgi:hypothetical protein
MLNIQMLNRAESRRARSLLGGNHHLCLRSLFMANFWLADKLEPASFTAHKSAFIYTESEAKIDSL